MGRETEKVTTNGNHERDLEMGLETEKGTANVKGDETRQDHGR